MQQAFASPVFRSLALGGLLLALTAGAYTARTHHKRRLVLHAVSEPGFLYLTAWRNGDVAVPFDGDKLVPLTFRTMALVNDGCRWLGTETLRPIAGGRYAYRYDETILECVPDARPYYKTPRTGIVTIEP
jgi:hypothetical protein